MREDDLVEKWLDGLESRRVNNAILHWNGIPVVVNGFVATNSGNWPLICNAVPGALQEMPAAYKDESIKMRD